MQEQRQEREYNLHSTMFLLIRISVRRFSQILTFTFHNVSINTAEKNIVDGTINNTFTFHNVSINTIY